MKVTDEQFKNLLLQAFEVANDIIIITEAVPLDPPGPRIVYVNKAFEELTGYTKEEVIGLNPRILQGPKSSAKVIKKISRCLRKNQSVHETIINYTKDGEQYWLDLSIMPLYDEKNIVSHFIAIERDVCEVKRLERKLKKLARHDSLTGILNRRFFFEMAERSFSLFLRNNLKFSILMIDLDDFKKINDKYGHIIGDTVLHWFGTYLKKKFRKSDLIGRYGGEEFTVLLSNTSLEEAKKKALDLKNSVDNSRIDLADNVNIHFTISIGVAEVANHDKSLAELLRRTDKLLYKAKENKKNCVAWM